MKGYDESSNQWLCNKTQNLWANMRKMSIWKIFAGFCVGNGIINKAYLRSTISLGEKGVDCEIVTIHLAYVHSLLRSS